MTVVIAGRPDVGAGDADAGMALASPADAIAIPATAMASNSFFIGIYMGMPFLSVPQDGSMCRQRQSGARGQGPERQALRAAGTPWRPR
jgi:hypothetical protein